ncbi:MAG: chromosomal replication initiator protein DnaA [Planctomycetota bacterium]|nr:MAG: chromosomal replication initiator protein DnaA [Planctomycetota bacterium]
MQESSVLPVSDRNPDRSGGETMTLAVSPSGAADELQDIWAKLQSAVMKRVQVEQFETWFRRAALTSVDDENVVLAVQNSFARDWLEKYYRDILEQSVLAVLGTKRTVTFTVDPELTVSRRPSPESPQPAAPAAAPTSGSSPRTSPPAALARTHGLLWDSDVVLNPKYTFDNFVVGPCNRFPHAAAMGAGESPGKSYNPFFLHGNVGLGKTHLLQSICFSILDRWPQVRILYLSCETFVNHFIGALENGDLAAFRNKYRGIDVLVVDDIHLLANKERTQEEFFHTFNTLYNAGKQIVLSSDSPPKDIPTLQDRLVSRFKWGMVTEIEAPCYETRMAIVKRKSRERGQEFPDDVAQMIAEHVEENVRELEGAVIKLLGYSNLTGQRVTTDLALEALHDIFQVQRGQPSMDDIIRVVTEKFAVKLSDLQSKKRTNSIAYPRQVAMFIARKITRHSLEEIGGFFGGRDHSTVLHAVSKISKLNTEDPDTQAALEGLFQRLQRH